MDLISQHFNLGVKTIITRHSPEGRPLEREVFSSSSHFSQEICFVLDGRSSYMFKNKVFDAVPGTVFLIDSWETHAFGYRKEDHDLLHLWLQIDPTERQISGSLFQVGSNGAFECKWSCFIVSPEYNNILSRRWKALNSLTDVSQKTVMEFLKAPLECLLDEVHFLFSHAENVFPENPKGSSVAESLKRYILMSNARDCSLEKLEKYSGYSRFYLSRKFRESEGCTIGEFINKVRIHYTAEALRKGLRQKEIAFELGFSSPSNFWIWLKKHKAKIDALNTDKNNNKIKREKK